MGGCDSVGCLQISGLKNMHVLCQCFGIKNFVLIVFTDNVSHIKVVEVLPGTKLLL
jgi:hypothetical protein